jgi:phage terminase large subunit
MLTIPTARIFEPLLHPARYLGAWGGRGSGKSWFFAEKLVERSLLQPGLRAVCVGEVQRTLAQSAKRLIEDKIQALGVGKEFRPLYDRIETPGGGTIMFQGMADHNAESVKSLENCHVALEVWEPRHWRFVRLTSSQSAQNARGRDLHAHDCPLLRWICTIDFLKSIK